MKNKILVTLLFAVIQFTSIQAQTTRVYVDSASTCLSCNGHSWGNAYSSLQDGIMNLSIGDTLFIAKGTYFPDDGSAMASHNNDRDTSFIFPDGVLVLGGFSPINGIDSIYERDFNTYPTVLSGEIQQDNNSANNSYHVVLSKNASSVSTSFDGLVIQDGNANLSTHYIKKNGGGWYHQSNIYSNAPILTNCTFRNNKASGKGGAIFIDGQSVKLHYCVFDNNIGGTYGGASHIEGYNVHFNNCTFSRNTAQRGGAISNNGANTYVRSSSFGGNESYSEGSSIYNDSYMYLHNSILYDEDVDDDVIENDQNLEIQNCIIEDCYYNNGTSWNSNFGLNQGGNLNLNPEFVDASNGNLHLKQCPMSEAMNKGNNSLAPSWIITHDMDGNSRIVSNTIDIGAYELNAGVRIDSVQIIHHHQCTTYGKAKAVITSLGNTSTSYTWANGSVNQISDSLPWGINKVWAYDSIANCYDSSEVFIEMDYSQHRIYVDSTAAGENTGCNWVDAFPFLQDALKFARNGDTIFISKGSYFPDDGYLINNNDEDTSFVIPSGVTLIGGFNPSLGIDLVHERNSNQHPAILSGDVHQDNIQNNNSTHIVSIIEANQKVYLDGLIIQEGYAFGSNNEEYGGGFYIQNSNFSLYRCILRNNKSDNRAAAIYIDVWDKGDIEIDSCLFDNNICGHYAGGIYARFNINNTNRIKITNSVFNKSQGYGSSVISNFGANMDISNCVFKKSNFPNISASAGAILMMSGELNLSNCELYDNYGYRGGALNMQGGTFTIDRCNFYNNKSHEEGGAVYILNTDDTMNTITDCVFNNNESLNGSSGAVHISGSKVNIDRSMFKYNTSKNAAGAIFIHDNSFVDGLNITNSVFLFNTSTTEKGGAIFSLDSRANIVNCSFYNNTSFGAGKAIYTRTYTWNFEFKIINSILYSNSSANFIVDNYYSSNKALVKNSIVKGSGGSGSSWVSSFGDDQGGNLDVNPNYINAPLGNIRLQTCPPSSAINAGLNTSYLTNRPYDYYGNARKFHNGTVDIGAYESSLDNGFVYNETIIHLCDGDSILIGNQYIASTMIQIDTVYGINSCDSIYNTQVLFKAPVDDTTFAVTACTKYHSPSGAHIWTNSGTYTDTLISNSGCDSITNIQLTINHVNTTLTSDTNFLQAASAGADHYQWLDCNNGMSVMVGDTLQNLIILQSGNYAAEISENGCVDTSSCHPIIFVGIEEITNEFEIKVFPNPSYGQIHIVLPKTFDKVRLRLYNTQGSLLGEKVLTNVSRYDLERDLSNGIYILEVILDQQINTFKVIVQ